MVKRLLDNVLGRPEPEATVAPLGPEDSNDEVYAEVTLKTARLRKRLQLYQDEVRYMEEKGSLK